MATDQHPGSDASMTQLVSGIINDAQQLTRQQFALFKAEIREDFAKTKQASVSLLLAAGFAGLSAILLGIGIALLLAWAVPAVPLWGWFLISGAVLAAVAGAFFYAGRKQFQSLEPLPDQSAQALRENVQWIMHPK
jgi:hypothetical protein